MGILRAFGSSLANLLRRGFERTIALTVGRSITPDALTGVIMARRPDLDLPAATALADHIRAGIDTAQNLNSPVTGPKVKLADLPENEWAGGDGIGPNRVVIDADVSIFGDSGQLLKTYRIGRADPDLPDNEALKRWLQEEGIRRYRNYEVLSILFTDAELSSAVADIRFAQRRF